MSSTDEAMRIAGTAVVLRDSAEGIQTLLMRRPSSGSFADAWVFPGGRVDPDDWREASSEQDAARHAAIRETREETGIHVHAPVLLSRWVPPREAPVRYRTWFFLVREHGEEARPNPGEIEELRWMTPQHAFAQHEAGGFTLVPPTWVTLRGLLGHDTVDDAFAAAGAAQFYATQMQRIDGGHLALWAGDELHEGEPGATGRRHRLTMRTPPWSYQRD